MDNTHRPWPVPTRAHAVAMRWEALLFMHWPIDAAWLRPHVPKSLSIDEFGGSAWIGIVPFRMVGIRSRVLPPLPGLSRFPELNVRTYVTVGGKPGVWFFSLDAAHRIAVWTARRVFHLNYCLADMSCTASASGYRYTSRRIHRGLPPADFAAQYRPVAQPKRCSAGSLEHFLTERYCLYSIAPGGELFRGEIAHEPWPLQPAEAEVETNTMANPLGFSLPDTKPLLHYADRLDVVAWRLDRVNELPSQRHVR